MKTTPNETSPIYGFTLNRIDGQPQPLSDYHGKVLLIVNVASECGLTPQYADLQEFYRQYRDQGLEILGFPANNFGAQEPGSNAEIQTFCTNRYSVAFPMFEKISVTGSDQHPLYAHLTQATDSEVEWNFQKYLVDRQGRVVQVIKPTVNVFEEEVLGQVETLLAMPGQP